MSKKTDGAVSPVSSAKAASALKSLREKIDKVDLQILKFINERAVMAAEISRLNNDQNAEVFSPAREEEVIRNVLDHHKGPMDAYTVRAIFRELMSGSR